MKHLLSFLVLVITSVGVGAEPMVLTGATVYTGLADKGENVSIVIDGEDIVYVGNDSTQLPEDAQSIDLSGHIITAGMIDSFSTLGLEEVGMSTNAEDIRYEGIDMGAAVNPLLAYNPDSSLIPAFLYEGVTQVVLRQFVSKDILAGQMAMVSLSADYNRFDGPHGVLAYIGESGWAAAGKNRAVALHRLGTALDEAGFYRTRARDAEKRMLRDLSFPRADLEALSPVVTGDSKLVVYVDRASDIKKLLAQTADSNVDLILVGAREAWKVAAELQETDVPVLLNPMDNLPLSFDRQGARLDQPALLHEAGVRFAYMSEDPYSEGRLLTQGAGVSVAYGLPWIEGLRALTSSPAEIWGIDNVGTLESGNEATLVVWNADPLEITSHVERVMVAGEWVQAVNRQIELRDRYSEIRDPKPFGYRYE